MDPFWKTLPLAQMSPEQWESLCDGCAKCCMQKLEDVDTREVVYTNVVCDLLDLTTCRCSDYPNRSTRVPGCVTLTLQDLEDPYWLPSTCAYRLLAEGEDLPEWHPLICDDPTGPLLAGHSVMGRVIHERDADEDLEQHLIDWVS